MLPGASAPPAHSGFTWSITYPGHGPLALPVDGHGCACLKSCFALRLRLALLLCRVVTWEPFLCEPELDPLLANVALGAKTAASITTTTAARIAASRPSGRGARPFRSLLTL